MYVQAAAAAQYLIDQVLQLGEVGAQQAQTVDQQDKGGESSIGWAVDPDNPWRGTGFAGKKNSPNIATPELKMDAGDYVGLADVGPAEMWVRGYDGSQELLAVFKAGKWVLV